jgi:hypothetical protein
MKPNPMAKSAPPSHEALTRGLLRAIILHGVPGPRMRVLVGHLLLQGGLIETLHDDPGVCSTCGEKRHQGTCVDAHIRRLRAERRTR